MPRIRTIKPEFWQDEIIGELSTNARLLFIASWNLADDEGLLKWNPAFMRAQVFAFDEFSIAEVSGFMQEITDRALMACYQDAKKQSYAWIPNFRKHQKIDRPQKPKHPLPSLQNPRIRDMYASRQNWCCAICGEEIIASEKNRKFILSLDHIKPRASGGGDEPSNIQAVHFGCNASKRDKFDEDSSSDIVLIDEDSHEERKGKEQGKEVEQGTGNREQADKLPTPAEQAIEYLNSVCGAKFQKKGKSLGHANARIDEGHTLDDLKLVVDAKWSEWRNDTKMAQYLRPETLFGASKFPGYLVAAKANGASAHTGFDNREYTETIPDWEDDND